jgi:CopG family nickel-responsive transcriptional regulator
MPDLVRLSISIEKPLYARLERLRRQARFRNRSEFLRGLVRDKLVERQWQADEEALGTVTLIYNHRQRQLSEKLTDLQHHHHHHVLAATHVHLDVDLCAEMVMLKGPAEELREIADRLRQQKGVLHAALAMSSTGRKLA